MKKLNICLVSDFFYPGFGGVESHLYGLATSLLKNGHKVVLITKAVKNRVGVRYMTKLGLKIYYLPFFYFLVPSGQTTFLDFIFHFPFYRSIFIRERIDIIHSHQSRFFY
jgi:phosphatidylinositol N-acetylglucosaminyltransferase subunit A